MTAITSGALLKEFTLFADRAQEENETFIVQRANGKHLVLLSMDAFNALQKALYLAKQEAAGRCTNHESNFVCDSAEKNAQKGTKA